MRRVAQAAGGRAAVRLGRQAGAHRVLVSEYAEIRILQSPSACINDHLAASPAGELLTRLQLAASCGLAAWWLATPVARVHVANR